MSRRVKRPLRLRATRPKGARPVSGLAGRRGRRGIVREASRRAFSAPRAERPVPFTPEPEKVVAEAPAATPQKFRPWS